MLLLLLLLLVQRLSCLSWPIDSGTICTTAHNLV